MSKTKAALIATAALSAATLQLDSAAAHHPEVAAVGGCVKDAQASVFVTATAWDTGDPAHRVNNNVSIDWWTGTTWVPQALGAFTLTSSSFTRALILPATGVPSTFRVRAIATVQWGPNADLGSQGESRETLVTVDKVCLTVDPAPPSTTVPAPQPSVPSTAPDPKLPPFVTSTTRAVELPPAPPAQVIVTTPRYTG